MGLSIILTITVLVVVASLPTDAQADIGIFLSKSCQIMIKNNMDTQCPNYEEIMAIIPDGTNQDVSGKFEHVDGMYQRGEPQMKKSHNYYQFENTTRIWIDPPLDVQGKLQMIHLENNLNEFPIVGTNIIQNGTITVGIERHVHESCREATINAANFMILLGDTIRYLNHSCQEEYTQFQDTKTTVLEPSEIDRSLSYHYQLRQWFETMKQECRDLC